MDNNQSHLVSQDQEMGKTIAAIRPLFFSLKTLPHVAGTRQKLFERLLGTRVIDALLHLPSNIRLLTPISHMAEAKPGEIVVIQAEVIDHIPPQQKGKPYKVKCYDGRIFFDLVYFNSRAPYLKNILPLKSRQVIIGKAEQFLNQWKIHHPDRVVPAAVAHYLPKREVIYPLTTGLPNPTVTRTIESALSRLIPFPEWISSEILQEKSWVGWSQAIRSSHDPQQHGDLNPLMNKARERLIFDELFAHQLALQLMRRHSLKDQEGRAQVGNNILMTKYLSLLPYEPTLAQKRVLADILEDMAQPTAMSRLIQGDVGCGKTLVAFLSMLRAVESGNQAAILAPTDILARQHAQTMVEDARQLGLTAEILTAREKGKQRKKILEELANGQLQILIGTHAILEEAVQFKNLGIAVIDEQHRFGVEQRLALTSKASNPDVLSMTATPIPRTLQLTNYGDMDVSIIDEKPPGRHPIKTNVLPLNRLGEILEGLKRALASQTKVFWVCPLVEESEILDLAAAEQRFESLQGLFGERVGLVHGKMKAQDKDLVMDRFINGTIDILVATTVIEVGVNVPAATIMVIEHAERFGLAQLHQLRGRIGRGKQPGTCLLLYGHQISSVGRKRLETMRETDDGFKIAEVDLELRGGGDILGTRQSGLPGFKLADFIAYPDHTKRLLSLANQEARKLCIEDPYLTGIKGVPARILLTIFGKDDAFKYMRT